MRVHLAMTRTKKKAQRGVKSLISCTVCDKKFGLESKLQRHLLENHVKGVTVELPDRESASEGQWRAHEGVQKALGVANGALAETDDPEGALCPQCLPDSNEKKWKNPLSLATHIMSKHCDELSDADGNEQVEARSKLAEGLEESERVSTTKKRSARAVESPVEDVAKRTKLLCVDVSQKGALVPPSATLPNPPKAIKPAAKAEPDLVDPVEKRVVTNKRPAEVCSSGILGDAKKPKISSPKPRGVTVKPSLPVPSAARALGEFDGTTSPPASKAEDTERVTADPESGSKATVPKTVTANRPPLTPKTSSAAKACTEAGAKPAVTSAPVGTNTAAEDAAALAAAAAATVIATTPTKQTLVAEPSPLGGLSRTIVSRGFDMDSGDVCDFPSSVERAYYRSSRKLESGGDTTRR